LDSIAHSDPEYIQQVLKVGAAGYLVQAISGDIVAQAIRELKKGKTFFTPSIAKAA